MSYIQFSEECMFLFYLTGTLQPNHLHCNWGWIGHFILFNKFQQWTYFCARYFDKGQLCILYCKKWFTILYISQKWGFKQQFIYSSCTFVFSSVLERQMGADWQQMPLSWLLSTEIWIAQNGYRPHMSNPLPRITLLDKLSLTFKLGIWMHWLVSVN